MRERLGMAALATIYELATEREDRRRVLRLRGKLFEPGVRLAVIAHVRGEP
jgi:hypothetical protein